MIYLSTIMSSDIWDLKALYEGANVQRLVASVTIMESLPIREWAKGGELLLTSSRTLPENEQDLLELLHDMQRLSTAALAVKCRETDEHMARVKRLSILAQEWQIPIFLIPPQRTYLSLTNAINRLLSLADEQGSLVSYADKAYVDQAHAAGLQVWGMLGDVNGSPVKTGDVLAGASAIANIIQQLMQIATDCGMDGINVDFESIREDSAPQYLQFLKELCVAAHAQNLVVSTDNFVPTYTKYYKRAEQAKTVDYLIIMGYDEHTASSEEIGSVASLPFVEQGIQDTLKEVPAGQVINAIPFYTRSWVETFGTSVPESQALGMDAAAAFVEEHGIVTAWDASVGQNVGSVEDGSARYSIWLEDEQSVEAKMKLIDQYDLAGVAGWRLGFERASVWNKIAQYLAE